MNLISSLVNSFIQYQEPHCIQRLKEFDAHEFEANVILSLDLETLSDQNLTKKIVKRELKRKVDQLMKRYMKEFQNKESSSDSSGDEEKIL